MKKLNLPPAVSRLRRHITKKRLALTGGAISAVVIAIPVITYANYAQDISDQERLMNRNNTGIVLRDKNGEVFYEYGRISGSDNVTLSQISDNLEKAVVASEDQDFWNHEGYSVKGIASAAYANLLNKDATRYGGSTITQQLVKNKLLTSDKSYMRKYQELSMAVAVERRYTKEQILEMYLNSVYFGEGAFGITDAAKTYFNKSPQDLTVAESSMLIGLLPAPSTYSPVTGDKEKAKEQQNRVLSKMAETNAISASDREQAEKAELALNPGGEKTQEQAQHFAMMVIEELKEKYGEETITRLGYDVTTTLDMNWQRQAETNARERVAALGAAGARNAGVVAIDPKNGQIRALVGSVDWNNPTFGKVNTATSPRQPGSSFKPIYYTEALDKKLITPATIMQDQAKTYGGNYKPTNYDFKYRGNIAIRNALAQSLNIPAVDVMQKLGTNEAAAAAQRMGISTVNEPQKYGLSLALGTAEVKLAELTNAYAAFANNGEQYDRTLFTAIKDKYDDEVYTYKQPKSKQVMSPEASYLISSILSDNNARAPTFGNNLTVANRTVAVKTGTTNDSKDAWTVGYTPNVVVGVWMGNNENEPMAGLAGSSSAGGVWRSTISKYLEGLPKEDFKKPSSIVTMRVCTGSGLKAANGGANTYEESFIKGSEPTQDCNQKKQETKQEDKPKEEPEKRREEEQPEPETPRQENQNRDTNNNTQEREDEGGRGSSSEEDDETTTQPPPPTGTGTTAPPPATTSP